ncbi:MAG: ABC transporter permease [Ignavibacteriaceae bacterium]|nr:ABC transporter permease [Ignavibacteriaceae bacterium]
MYLIYKIIIKEFHQFRRDPKMFGIILIAPVIQLTLLGFAATLDIKSINLAVLDNDKSAKSRELVENFTSSGYFKPVAFPNNYDELQQEIDGGNILLALVIPNNFEESIMTTEGAKLQAIFNGSDGNTANLASGYTRSVISGFSNKIQTEYLEKNGVKNLPVGIIKPQSRVWYNPELESRKFMVPGIVGLLMSIVTILLTSLAIVKEKEIGTLEQLIVTPIKPYQLIIGKLIPFTILAFAAAFLAITAMRFIFGIEVRGDIVFLFVSAFLYILSTLGLGLLVSTFAKTQQQAMMFAVFGVLMPFVYLSGFAFPVENMPVAFQWISHFISLKYFIEIIRGVILKGGGWNEYWYHAVMLLILGITILAASVFKFKKKLD